MSKILLNTVFLLGFVVVSTLNSFSQCPSGEVTFYDQRSIDLFPVSYPGCTQLNSNLRVYGSDTKLITDLSGLSAIKVIKGNLHLQHTLIQNLTGLENIDSVYGSVIIEDNIELKGLEEISEIKFIGYELEISHNHGIRVLDTFRHIQHLNSLTIASNNNLTDISGLYPLKTIREQLWINGNKRLKSLYGLHEIDSVGQRLLIRYSDSLTTLQDLSGLAYVGKLITLLRNNLIKDLSGLENVLSDSLSIEIESNSALESLIGFPQVEKVQTLEVSYNAALLSMEGISALSAIEEDFIFQGNDRFTNLSGLENIEYINGELKLGYNDNLASIEELVNLIPDSLSMITIFNNPLLSECSTDFICSAVKGLDFPPTIYGNGTGCTSYHDVVKGCQIQECVAHYVFRSQKEIDEFPSSLPNCSFLPGDLLIEETEPGDIKNLDSLSQLKTVSGTICIKNNLGLREFSGLVNIESIGKSLQIIENDSLISLAGLNALKVVGGSVEIIDNTSLISLDGFESLEIVGGEFILSENARLQSVVSLSSLIRIDSNLTIGKNPNLQSLEGLESLSTIEGGISIYSNNVLRNLSGLKNVSQLGAGVLIYFNNSLDSLNFLNNVDSIKGIVKIAENPMLEKLSAFQSVVHIKEGLWITDNLAIKNFSGFKNLKRIEEDLILEFNPQLSSLSEFNQLDFIGEVLYISGTGIKSMEGFNHLHTAGSVSVDLNDSLVNFNGLDALERVGKIDISGTNIENLDHLASLEVIDELWLTDMPKLQNLPKFNKIKMLGGLYILGNDILKDLTGLDSLQSVARDVHLGSCPSLIELHGLENLKECGDGIFISRNDSLLNLNALVNLKSINGFLYLNDNDRLYSIDGIRNVLSESIHQQSSYSYPFSIEITDNSSLTICAIEPICDIVAGRIDEVLIHDNAQGCNSPIQVLSNCDYTNSCYVEGLVISDQGDIDSFSIKNSECNFVKGNVLIREEVSGSIINLEGLVSIKAIGGSLTIENNRSLEQLSGLDSLRLVGGSIIISNNESLYSISSIENIDPTYINTQAFEENHFVISNNINLSVCSIQPLCSLLVEPYIKVFIQGNNISCSDKSEVIDGCGFPAECSLSSVRMQITINEFPIRFPKCTELTGSLSIFQDEYQNSTDPVITLAPLSQLTTLNGGLTIRNTKDLKNLTGLENLRNINGNIEIKNNQMLESLAGINDINPESVLASVIISENPVLTHCAVESICHILGANELNIGVYGNDENCNTEIEILTECIVDIDYLPAHEFIRIFPNPTTGVLHIEANESIWNGLGSIEIYDLTGTKLKSYRINETISIADLHSGVYALLLYTREGRYYSSRIVIKN